MKTFLSTLSLRRATNYVVTRGNDNVFLSTLSLRRATPSVMQEIAQQRISIHALLAESDKNRPRPSAGIDDFYPRSPCGERPILFAKKDRQIIFLSTLSLRRATVSTPDIPKEQKHFYPRSPCGERRPIILFRVKSTSISIHALLAESDLF